MDSSPLVTTDRLEARLGRPGLRILDCSVIMRTEPDGSYGCVPGREEFDGGHIPGSTFVDVLGDLADADSPLPMAMPSVDAFARTMEGYGVGDGTDVVLYDRSNHAWAARVWWMLRAAGFGAAAVLDGGWRKWVAEGRGVSTETAAHPRGELTPRPRPELFATKERVLESLADERVSVVNALSPDEHSGAAPTRFPRAGRIPGSTNVYCQSLLDPETHAYRPVDELERLFADAGALDGEAAITYCGAGIAASSDALALTLIGARNVAVYDGSLAEWTADPALPMEADATE